MELNQKGSQRAPTLDDVAQQLGVSRATVSNAFNRPQLLSDATRERVLAFCTEFGYFGPNPMARAMRRPELREVAVVFHHDLHYAMSDPLSIEFLQGVAQELDRRQLSMHLIPRLGRRVNFAAAFQTASDAVIIHAQVPQELFPQLKALRKPLALVDAHLDALPSVTVDDFNGARLAMEHALSKTPQDIVVVALPVDPLEQAAIWDSRTDVTATSVGAIRMKGYVHALRAAQYPLDRVRWCFVGDDMPDDAAQWALPLLAQSADVGQCALVAMSDRMALGIMRALDCAGLAHPCSLVGYDDIAQAAHAGLTTIRQDATEKGRLAVQVALGATPSQVLRPRLVVRAT
jgi:DNA-binding LacI/PurR family transcriptional regulator